MVQGWCTVDVGTNSKQGRRTDKGVLKMNSILLGKVLKIFEVWIKISCYSAKADSQVAWPKAAIERFTTIAKI